MGKKKITRKMREQAFKKLKKHESSGLRIDKWGKLIDFHQYGMKTDHGWLIDDDGCAVSIGTIRIIKSWEKSR